MTALFTQRVRVRAYECDSLGHVNNAAYLNYLQQATLDAQGIVDDRHAVPSVRALSIEYQTPARYGDELDVTTWRGAELRGYEITRVSDGAVVVRAQMEWGGDEVRSEETDTQAMPLKPLGQLRDNGARAWFWRHRVRRYEVDATQSVNLAVYFNWLEEATFRTAHVSGWTMERLRAENFITLQYRHDAEFFTPVRNGEEIEIVSRLFDVRRVRATWIHELRRTEDGTLILRDYSTGAFLDWQGNIRSAPQGMMERLTEGE
ncbi:MAG TPA: acyl-CoA thioesterase [Anaerolineae bacterium]|nr:acyl-CoA thioesterase [Anaerolineae bacterium]